MGLGILPKPVTSLQVMRCEKAVLSGLPSYDDGRQSQLQPGLRLRKSEPAAGKVNELSAEKEKGGEATPEDVTCTLGSRFPDASSTLAFPDV